MVPEEDKVERIQKKNSRDQESIKGLPNPPRENFKCLQRNALELSVQGGLGQTYRKSQTCRQHALSYVDKKENV